MPCPRAGAERSSAFGRILRGMTRPARYFHPGQLQFITSSTYRRAQLFESERFRQVFAEVLGTLRQEMGFRLIGWVLMPEHFHLLLKPEPAEATNRISTVGGAPVSHDAAGDMTQDGTGVGTHTYQWDAEGRLVSVDGVAGQACQTSWTACYTYNGVGQRVEEKRGTTFREIIYGVYGETLAWRDATNFKAHFIYLGERLLASYQPGGTTLFVHPNHLGSTTFVTDQTGATVEKTLYYPWGQLWASAGTVTHNRFASMQERDAGTDLDPTPFRLYHSRLYRWLSPDPLAGDVMNPQSLNRYAYVGNNPTNFTDPLGLVKVPELGGGGGVLYAFVSGLAMGGFGFCTIDGLSSSCGLVYGMLASGAGVIGPGVTVRINPDTGTGEFFSAEFGGSTGWSQVYVQPTGLNTAGSAEVGAVCLPPRLLEGAG
jgi:RHS repeat-associated protein